MLPVDSLNVLRSMLELPLDYAYRYNIRRSKLPRADTNEAFEHRRGGASTTRCYVVEEIWLSQVRPIRKSYDNGYLNIINLWSRTLLA